MKLPDALRRKQDGDPLDERIAAEMDALDSALRGEQVDPEMRSLATLASDLRADREEIGSDFSARLDAWAAAGFPRGDRPGASRSTQPSAGSALERLRLRLASTPQRRLLAPVMAGACAVVIAGVVASRSGEIGGTSDSGNSIQGQTQIDTQPVAPSATDSGSGAESAGSARSGSAGNDSLNGGLPGFAAPNSKGATSSRDAASNAEHFLKPPGGNRGGNLDKIRRNRKVERDAQLALKADAPEVPDIASKAADVTERYKGHVLSSQVSGSSTSAQATLDLAIPTKNLDAAISDLSDLAEVSTRSEGSNDITRPFVSARDKLAGYRAERDSLLKRLAAADTDEETQALKSSLKVLNQRIADAKASVSQLKNRASISRVSLTISSAGMIGDTGNSNEDGWGIGDALHDAGQVLTVAGGVILISSAVLLPLALIALLAALAIRASRTRARERTLDE